MIGLGSDNHPVWQLHLDLAWRPVTFCIATFLPDFPLRLCKAAFLVTFQDKQFRLFSTSSEQWRTGPHKFPHGKQTYGRIVKTEKVSSHILIVTIFCCLGPGHTQMINDYGIINV